ncbi:hypothetical protein KCU78_g89, partial [Aureobasidium melanogenum]
LSDQFVMLNGCHSVKSIEYRIRSLTEQRAKTCSTLQGGSARVLDTRRSIVHDATHTDPERRLRHAFTMTVLVHRQRSDTGITKGHFNVHGCFEGRGRLVQVEGGNCIPSIRGRCSRSRPWLSQRLTPPPRPSYMLSSNRVGVLSWIIGIEAKILRSSSCANLSRRAFDRFLTFGSRHDNIAWFGESEGEMEQVTISKTSTLQVSSSICLYRCEGHIKSRRVKIAGNDHKHVSRMFRSAYRYWVIIDLDMMVPPLCCSKTRNKAFRRPISMADCWRRDHNRPWLGLDTNPQLNHPNAKDVSFASIKTIQNNRRQPDTRRAWRGTSDQSSRSRRVGFFRANAGETAKSESLARKQAHERVSVVYSSVMEKPWRSMRR